MFFSFFFFSIHTDVQLFSRFFFVLLFFHFKSNIIFVIVQIFKQINSHWLYIWRQCEFIATPRASAFYLRRNLSQFRSPAYHCVLVSAARLFCHFKFSFFSLFRKLKNIEKYIKISVISCYVTWLEELSIS